MVNTVEPPVSGRLTGSFPAAHRQAFRVTDEPCVGTAVMEILVNSKFNHRKETKTEDGMFLIEKGSLFFPRKC